MKSLSFVFGLLAVLISDVMFAVVTYEYCKLYYGMKYEGWSAAPEIAFLLLIPFMLFVTCCLLLSYLFKKKSKEV